MAENPDGSVLQWTLSGGAVVKLESGVSGVTSAAGAAGVNTLSPSQSAELHFLRARVRELEREKAELSAENHRLKNMLVHEIPGLLSTMWQTLGQGNTQPYVSAGAGRADSYAPYLHPHHAVTNPDGDISPSVNLQPRGPDELGGDLADFCVPLDPGEEEVPGGADVGSHMGEEAPLCSQTNMEELRRSCSESQCAAADTKDHVSQVEVYPGSGVVCDVRSWHAANQAPSPTAMARTLLMGVFDMTTLMNSNLRGGHSRRPASHSQRSALDPHKINAIFNAILARFPLARKGVIGSGINSKLSEIRFRSRKANRDPRFL